MRPHENNSSNSIPRPLKNKNSSDKLDALSDTEWKKKYHEADKKIIELRHNLNLIKNENNKAHRIITREIGENFNIDKVLLEENSWKGR